MPGEQMRAMVFEGGKPLTCRSLPLPEPGDCEVLIEVRACAVCRTDLHVVDADLKAPKKPVIPGHEIVGKIVKAGARAQALGMTVGLWVGVPWLGSTCGQCPYCLSARENLCLNPGFTGYTIDGGFAQYTVADARHTFILPPAVHDDRSAQEFSPMLCAGLIGWRSLRFARPALDAGGGKLGIYGFGAAGHIVAQVAIHLGYKVYAFVRPGDEQAQQFARGLGAVYAGSSAEPSPEELDAAIIFAPSGALVPAALKSLAPGGCLVLGGIHMSDIPALPYELLWHEHTIQSVANLTVADGHEFMDFLAKHKVTTSTEALPLEQANEALDRLRAGQVSGALVLTPWQPKPC